METAQNATQLEVRYAQARRISKIATTYFENSYLVVRRKKPVRSPNYYTSIHYPQARAELAQLAQENAQLQVDLGLGLDWPCTNPNPSPNPKPNPIPNPNPNPIPNLYPTPYPRWTSVRWSSSSYSWLRRGPCCRRPN